MDPFLPEDARLDALRKLLPSVASGIRLDTTLAGPFPAETERAIQELAGYELQVGRGGPERAEDVAQRADEARSVVAAVLGAAPDRVLLAPGPLAALSAAVIVRDRGARGGIVVAGELSAELDGTCASVARAHGLPLVRMTSEVPPEDATLVVSAHVDPVTGGVRDPRPLAAAAHAAGAPLLLDMGWSAGAIPVDAPGSGADLVLVGAHRWLLGPEGVTALWVADREAVGGLGDLLDPPPRTALLGLARSVGWLLMYVGLPWAFQRARQLTTRLQDALAAIEGVAFEAPRQGIATVLPFRITGWSASTAANELGRRVFARIEVDEPRDLLVAAVGAWLREDEIDRFADAVGEIAAHTPETLPPRPLLTLLDAMPGDER